MNIYLEWFTTVIGVAWLAAAVFTLCLGPRR